MNQFLLILLFLSSINLSSCVSYTTGYKEANVVSITPESPLANGYNVLLYKTQIDYKEKHFSGLFYFKAISDSVKRVVFMSEIGLSFFDFEFNNGEFEVKSCQEFFNKKAIINILRNDLELLVKKPQFSKIREYKNDTSALKKISLKGKSGKLNYFYPQTQELSQIVKPRGILKTCVCLSNYDESIPKSILIEHPSLNLKMSLQLLSSK